MNISKRIAMMLENQDPSTVKEAEEKDLETKVIDLLTKNPGGDDVNKFLEDNKIEKSQLESEIYKYATLYARFLKGGKSGGVKSKDVNPEQLKKGIAAEMEHTPDKQTAEKIALDHLIGEDPLYYDHLAEMEKKYSSNEEKPTEDKPEEKEEKGTDEVKGSEEIK